MGFHDEVSINYNQQLKQAEKAGSVTHGGLRLLHFLSLVSARTQRPLSLPTRQQCEF